MQRNVYAVVGPIASGKGTVIKYLVDHGFYSSSTSDRIREEIRLRGDEITRESLNKVSNELREKYGSDILAKRTAEILDMQDNPNVVIDSIRNPEEINYLKNKYGITVIAVLASQDKRYELFKLRGNNDVGIDTFEQFKDLDDREITGSGGTHSQRVNDVIEMADYVIENEGTINELEEKIGKIIN